MKSIFASVLAATLCAVFTANAAPAASANAAPAASANAAPAAPANAAPAAPANAAPAVTPPIAAPPITPSTVATSNVSTASAPSKPPADCGLDKDHDGWCVPDSSRSSDDPYGFLLGEMDCNDVSRSVNPGATEILGDGVDNDCDGDTKDNAPAYAKAFCGTRPTARCVQVMKSEIEQCESDDDACGVDKVAGNFEITFGWHFIDTNCDGVRELIPKSSETDPSYEGWIMEQRKTRNNSTWSPPQGWNGRCGGRSATSGGAPKSAAPKLPPATDPALLDRVGKAEAEVAIHAIALPDHDRRLITAEEVLNSNTYRLDELESDLGDETIARKDGDAALDVKINGVMATAEGARDIALSANSNAGTALETSVSALSTGVYADVLLGYSIKPQKGMEFHGRTLRGGLGHIALLIGRVGVERDFGRLLLTGGLGAISDKGPGGFEAGLLGRAGPELDFELSPVHSVGIGAGYIHQSSGGDVVGANAESRGGYLELAFTWSPDHDSALRTPVRIALDATAGELGTRGEQGRGSFKGVVTDVAGMFSVTFGCGLGPSHRQ